MQMFQTKDEFLMKRCAKRLSVLVMAILVFMPSLMAQEWANQLVNRLKIDEIVDKQISILRNPENKKVERENYIFTFKDAGIYSLLKSNMLRHTDEAVFFEMSKEKYPSLVMRLVEGDIVLTMYLVKVENYYKFTFYRASSANAELPVDIGVRIPQSAQDKRKSKSSKRDGTIIVRKSGTVVTAESSANDAEIEQQREALRKAKERRHKTINGK